MSLVLYLIAAMLFFFAGVGVTLIPNPVVWGLFCLALGFAVGNRWPLFVKGSQ